MNTIRYAVSLASVNYYQQQCHPIYWLIAPLLTEETVTLGSRWSDEGVVLNSDSDRWPSVVGVLIEADISGSSYLWNSLKFFWSDGSKWRRLPHQDLMEIAASV